MIIKIQTLHNLDSIERMDMKIDNIIANLNLV